MRLWHYQLIPKLDDKRLLGQHRECCALRGNGWNKKHSTVDYVFKHHPFKLFVYHKNVMDWMKKVKGFNINEKWYDIKYRGKNCDPWDVQEIMGYDWSSYPEHNKGYLKKCKKLLLKKDSEYYEEKFKEKKV